MFNLTHNLGQLSLGGAQGKLLEGILKGNIPD